MPLSDPWAYVDRFKDGLSNAIDATQRYRHAEDQNEIRKAQDVRAAEKHYLDTQLSPLVRELRQRQLENWLAGQGQSSNGTDYGELERMFGVAGLQYGAPPTQSIPSPPPSTAAVQPPPANPMEVQGNANKLLADAFSRATAPLAETSAPPAETPDIPAPAAVAPAPTGAAPAPAKEAPKRMFKNKVSDIRDAKAVEALSKQASIDHRSDNAYGKEAMRQAGLNQRQTQRLNFTSRLEAFKASKEFQMLDIRGQQAWTMLLAKMRQEALLQQQRLQFAGNQDVLRSLVMLQGQKLALAGALGRSLWIFRDLPTQSTFGTLLKDLQTDIADTAGQLKMDVPGYEELMKIGVERLLQEYGLPPEMGGGGSEAATVRETADGVRADVLGNGGNDNGGKKTGKKTGKKAAPAKPTPGTKSPGQALRDRLEEQMRRGK